MAKSSSKKTVVAKKTNSKPKANSKTRTTNTALHEKLIKLFARPDGATLSDVVNAGWKFPAMAALRIAERRNQRRQEAGRVKPLRR